MCVRVVPCHFLRSGEFNRRRSKAEKRDIVRCTAACLADMPDRIIRETALGTQRRTGGSTYLKQSGLPDGGEKRVMDTGSNVAVGRADGPSCQLHGCPLPSHSPDHGLSPMGVCVFAGEETWGTEDSAALGSRGPHEPWGTGLLPVLFA